MTKAHIRANIGVFWNLDDSPIPDGLDPTTLLEYIKSALENIGYLGRLIQFRAYSKDRSELDSFCEAAGIHLRDRVSKVGYAEVDHMLVDLHTWGLYNPAPSNLMVISKNISEGAELFGVLEDLKSLNYNILVSSIGDAPEDMVCLSTHPFGGGKPVDQSISLHGVSNKLAHVANTGVFWNLDDCEIPDDVDIYQNVKSALANQGCHGQMSMWAYCEEAKEPIPGITLVSPGDETARFKKMLRDILVWTLQNPIQRPRTTVPSLMVISKISRNIEFARVLNMLSARDYNVLLTVPDEKEYLCSVWLYPRLLQYLTKFPICTRSDKSLHDIKTCIFWNITGCTIPNDIRLDEINQNIKLAIKNQGHHGEVSIKAYWHGTSGLYQWLHGTINLEKRLSGDHFMKLDAMFVDILLWAVDNPAPSNLMVISETISQATELSSLLRHLESKGYNILVAHAEEAASPVLPPACLEWRLDTIFAGGNPINRTNYSRDVLNMIQNDLSFRRNDCHEANTAIFWDIEDCPIPGGLDPLMFLQNIKSALNHGCRGKLSIMVYCDNNRSLDDFSLSDTSPITLVHTDPYAVGYVDSVWLSTSLFGGGKPIDLKERKNHRSPIMLSSV
ncbi:putative endonuclease or glycosyl hydrolase [Raphanus sativus]|nr:putative endonuclease or glycosyl hydrolase [Raphanus sativus]